MSAKSHDIWKDPRVVEALKERAAWDIAVLDCPKCGAPGYYNEGSHFTCLHCKKSFYCCSEGEDAPDHMPYLHIEEANLRQLSDCVDMGEVP